MKSRIWIGAFALCAVALAAWLAWSLRADDASGTPTFVPSAGPGFSRARADEPALSTEPAVRTAAESAATEATIAAPDAGSHLLVRVVDKASAASVPGAEIRWMEVGEADFRAAREMARIDGLLAARGNQMLADAAGLARVPWPRERPLLIAGQSGELWGSQLVPTSAGDELRLELVRDFSIDVLVRAPGRAAEGLPVALALEHFFQVLNLLVVYTDAEGRARLPHAGAAIARRQATQGADLWIAAAIPLAEPVRVRLDPAAPPSAPVVLELPATGSLEVQVRTLAGAPVTAGSVELLRRFDEEQRARDGFMRRSSQHAASARIQDSVAHFPAVGLGLDLRARVRVDGAGVPTEMDFAGPASDGQRVSVEVVIGSDHPVLRLRILDEALSPVSDVQLGMRMETMENQRGEMYLQVQLRSQRTAADGTLEVHLERSDEAHPGRALTLLLAAHEERAASEARLDLSRAFADGLHELGDVVLARSPLLAAGRVVDGDGEPLAGARLAGSSVVGAEDFTLGVAVQSDAEGRFELRARCSTAETSIRADMSGRSSSELRCTVGARDLELVLVQPGSMAGSLLTEGRVPLSALAVRATRKSGLPDETGGRDGLVRHFQNYSTAPRPDGSFLLQGLTPGTYELTVAVRSGHEALVTLSNLVVPPGGACEDPRLTSIAVRGGLQRVQVDLVPSDPEASMRGHYTWRSAGEESFEVAFLDSRRIELVGRGPFDLRLHAAGHRAVRIDGLDSDRTLHLERGLPVRLKLPEGLQLPEPPLMIQATLRDPRDDDYVVGHFGAPAFDARGELSILVGEPGELQVILALERVDESGWRSWHLDVEPRQITARDTWREQLFSLELTQEVLDRAVESDD